MSDLSLPPPAPEPVAPLGRLATPPAAPVSIHDFELIRVLGKGCAGKVLLVRQRRTHEVFALKTIQKRHVLAHQELHHTLTEQAVLARTSSSPSGHLGPESGLPFIVKLWYSFHDTRNLYLVMDFHPGGDLATQLARWGRLGTDRARFYAAEIAEGVEALHGAGIIYRDLKPENVLIGADGHIVLSDFGLSKEFPRPGVEVRSPHWLLPSDTSSKHGGKVPKEPLPPDTTMTFCGTAEYLAPEVISGQPYSYQADWWSFGTMLYEMLAGYTPFAGESHTEMYVRVLREPLSFPDPASRGYDPTAWDQDTRGFLRGLLQKAPGLRLQEPRLKRHPYFGMIEWDHIHYRRYIPPYVPHVDPHNQEDTRNFDESFLGLRPNLDFDEDESDDPDTDEVQDESPQERARRRKEKDEATAASERARLLGEYREAVAATGDDPAEVFSLFEGYNFTASLDSEPGSESVSDEYPNPYAHESMDLDLGEEELEHVPPTDEEQTGMEQSVWDDTSESVGMLPSASSKPSAQRELSESSIPEQQSVSLSLDPASSAPPPVTQESTSTLTPAAPVQPLSPKPRVEGQMPQPTYAPGSVKARLAAIEAAQSRAAQVPAPLSHAQSHAMARSHARPSSAALVLEDKQPHALEALPPTARTPAALEPSQSQSSGLVARDFAASASGVQGAEDSSHVEREHVGAYQSSSLTRSSPYVAPDRDQSVASTIESTSTAPMQPAPVPSGLPIRPSDSLESSAPIRPADISFELELSDTPFMTEWTSAMERDSETVPNPPGADMISRMEDRRALKATSSVGTVPNSPIAAKEPRSPPPTQATMDVAPSHPPSSLERHASTMASSPNRHKPKAPSASSSIATPVWVPAPAGTTVKIVSSSRLSSTGQGEAPASTPASPAPAHVPLLHTPPRIRAPSHPLSMRWSLAEAAEFEEYEASALLAAAVLEELDRQAGITESTPPASAPATVATAAPAMTASASMPPVSAPASGPRESAATTRMDSSASFSGYTGDPFVSDVGNTTATTGNTTAVSTSSHAIQPPRPTSPTSPTSKFPPSTLSTSGSLKRALHFRWRLSLGRQESISEHPTTSTGASPASSPARHSLPVSSSVLPSSPTAPAASDHTVTLAAPAATDPSATTSPPAATEPPPPSSVPAASEPPGAALASSQPDESSGGETSRPAAPPAFEPARLERNMSNRKPTDIVSIAAAAAQASLDNPNVVPSASFSCSRRGSRSIHSSLHAAQPPEEEDDWDLLDDIDANLLAEGEGERNGGGGLSAFTPRVYSSTARRLRKSRQALHAARRMVVGRPVDEYRLRKPDGKVPPVIPEEDEPADPPPPRSAHSALEPSEHRSQSPPHPPKRRRPPSSVTAGPGPDAVTASPATPGTKAASASASLSPTSRPSRKRALHRFSKIMSPASLDTLWASPGGRGDREHDEDGDTRMKVGNKPEELPSTSPVSHAPHPRANARPASTPRGKKNRRFSLFRAETKRSSPQRLLTHTK